MGEIENEGTYSLEKTGRCNIEAAKAAYAYFAGLRATDAMIDDFTKATIRNGQESVQKASTFNHAVLASCIKGIVEVTSIADLHIGIISTNDQTVSIVGVS